MRSEHAIGLFDSGIGGLTVAKAISEAMPQEQMLYFGDTAHHPYGEKSADSIKDFALRIGRFLVEDKQCKALVIACNTASAVAYETLRDKYKGHLPVINVIDPVVEHVIVTPEVKTLGIIATQTTIESNVYQEKLSRRKPSLKLQAMATPLLAPMIEEGFGHDEIQEAILYEYLEDERLQGIDGLVLGCTHYPLIRPMVEHYYKHSIPVFDSTAIVAQKLKRILGAESLLSTGGVGNPPQNGFFVSDFTPTFELSAKRFYGQAIHFIKQTV